MSHTKTTSYFDDKFCTCKKPNAECFMGKLINLPDEKRDLLIDTGLWEIMFSSPKKAAQLRTIVYDLKNLLDNLKDGCSSIPTD